MLNADRQAGRKRDMTELAVAFSKSANATENHLPSPNESSVIQTIV